MQLFNSSARVSSRAEPVESPMREQQGLRLLLTKVRSEVGRRGAGSVVAFTSVNQGEGVSHVVQFFAEKLASQTGRHTVVVDAPRLRDLRVGDFMKLPGRFAQTTTENLWLLTDELEETSREPLNQAGLRQDSSEWGLDPLQALAANFAYTLIDCPAIGTSLEAELLAPDVDGFVLVVEADRTRREDILRARRTIEMANGKLMALVLNKRRYLVPKWIYRAL